MFSIAPLASADYYLKTSAGAGEVFNYLESNKGDGGTSDPLLRPGRWLGNFAPKLGLDMAAPISKQDFESIYYGLDPKTQAPLRQDGMPLNEQQKAVKTKAALDEDFVRARQTVKKAKVKVKELTQKLNSATGDYSANKEALEKAKQELELSRQQLLETEKAQAKCRVQRPGSDLVLSAPKSVSMQLVALMAAGMHDEAKAIEQAHDRAVRATFERIQSEFVMTRRRDPETSQRVLETVEGVVAAQWRHFDARPTSDQYGEDSKAKVIADPQLHDHINLFSPVEGYDGEIYAAYTDFIKANVKGLGAMYRAHLAAGLAAEGYGIEMDNQAKGRFFSIAGITAAQTKGMSKRSHAIAEAKSRGLSQAEAKILSREGKSTMSGIELIGAWGAALQSIGVDPTKVIGCNVETFIQTDAAAQAKKLGLTGFEADAFIDKQMKARQARARTNPELMQELLSMQSHFSQADIRQKLWEDAQFITGVSPDQLNAVVDARMREFMAQDDLLVVYDPFDRKSKGHMHGLNRFGEAVFTSKLLRERENDFFGVTVLGMLGEKGYGISESAAMAIIKELEASESQRLGTEFKLRDFQLRAALQAACGDGQLCVQIAGAGLGKTTAAKFTKQILEEHGRKVIGVAPSNKAATGLGHELGIETSSVDSLLIRLESEQVKLDANTVIFVDEVGMTSFDLMEKLLGHARSSGAKLILTGDPEQLPSVARGNVLRKLVEMKDVATDPKVLFYMGEKQSQWDYVSRQKHDWAKLASTYIAKGYVQAGLEEYERRGFVHSAIDEQELIKSLVDGYLADTTAVQAKMVLASTNRQVQQLNRGIREAFKASGVLKGSCIIEKTGMPVAIGERLIFKEKIGKRLAGVPVSKNEFGTVLSARPLIDGSVELEVQLDSPGRDGSPQIARFNSKHAELDHAYATTIHRSQGMTVDSVHAAASTFISKELFYVMSTRHRHSLHLHMLESERATILKNAAGIIEKRHANELEMAEGHSPEVAARLSSSNKALAKELDLAQKDYKRSILDRLAEVPQRIVELATQDVRKLLTTAINTLAAQASIFKTEHDLAQAALVAQQNQRQQQIEEQQRQQETNQRLQQQELSITLARKLWGDVAVQGKSGESKLEAWSSGKQWLAHDEHFIYTRDETTHQVQAWLKRLQDKGMIAAAEVASKTLQEVEGGLNASSVGHDRTDDFVTRLRAAWAAAPVFIDVKPEQHEVRIRVKTGVPQWEMLKERIKNSGGGWDQDAWVFSLKSAKAVESLIRAGIELGFEVKRQKTGFELDQERAWATITELQKTDAPELTEIKDLLGLIREPGDILTADDDFNAGIFVDSLKRVDDSTRKAQGVVVHENESHCYVALRDAQGQRQTKVLRVEKSAAMKLAHEVEILFSNEGEMLSASVPAPTPAPAPIQAPPSPYKCSLLQTQSIEARFGEFEAMCKARGFEKMAQALNPHDPNQNFICMQFDENLSRVNGVILGVSADSVFITDNGMEVLEINRHAQGMSHLDDDTLLNMVGWRRTVEGQAGRVSIEQPEFSQGLTLAEPPQQANRFVARFIRADNGSIYAQPTNTGKRVFYQFDINDPALASISARDWSPNEGQEIILNLDAEGRLVEAPVLKNGEALSTTVTRVSQSSARNASAPTQAPKTPRPTWTQSNDLSL